MAYGSKVCIVLLVAFAFTHSLPASTMRESVEHLIDSVSQVNSAAADITAEASDPVPAVAVLPPVNEDDKMFFPLISFGGKPVAVVPPPPPPPPPQPQLIIIPPNTPISVTSPGVPITVSQPGQTTVVTSGKK